MTTTPDPVMTVAQAVDYLGNTVSERTLRRLVSSGDIRSIRIGGKLVRVRASALEDYLNRSPR